MSDTPRPGRPRGRSTDSAILAATADRLSRHGYERMTLDDVARDAGVTRPTVYRRWSTKEDLAIAAVANLITSSSHQPTGDARQDLHDQARQLFSNWSNNQYLGLLGAAIVERENHRELYDALLERLIRPRRKALLAILNAGVERGVVRSDVDAEVVVTMFVGSFYAVSMAESWSELEIEGWANRLVESTMRLISPVNTG